MRTKRVELLETKADGAGTFTALASVFGNEDLQGDRVMPGAFKKTIAKMAKAGRVLPIVSSHNHEDPRFTIGTARAEDLTETDRGLEVKGQLDLDNPIAAQVHRLFKSGAWTGWSFGYSVVEEKTGKDGANELTELDLIEAGPCLKGANPEAQLLEAKSALAEAEPTRTADNAWDPSPKRFTDTQWKRAAALDRGPSVEDLRRRYGLPICEPSGRLNPHALKVAAEEIEVTVATNAAIREARSNIRHAFASLGKDAPENIAISEDEEKGEIEGLLKAVWSAAYVNDLPDSCFLYIETGGSTDSEGKTTPRSLRHFPVKDAEGSVDLPHLRNALSRIPQSSLPQEVKDRVAAMAERMLSRTTSAVDDIAGKEAETAKPRDPLKDQLVASRLDDLRH